MAIYGHASSVRFHSYSSSLEKVNVYGYNSLSFCHFVTSLKNENDSHRSKFSLLTVDALKKRGNIENCRVAKGSG